MNTRTIPLAILVVVAVSQSCRTKATGKAGSTHEESTARSSPAFPAGAGENHATTPDERSLDQADAGESSRPSYANMEKDLMDALALIPPPRTKEEYAASRIPYRKLLDRRKELLFSISISHKAERDRDEVWSKLEQSAYSSDEQYRYTKNFLNSYSEAPQVEKLVMWELLRCRMDYWRMQPGGGAGLGGVGTEVELLRIEMARLLFSALGIDKKELFDALDPHTRNASDEADSKGFRAEEEIERIHLEQSKVAEQILEKHWKLPK